MKDEAPVFSSSFILPPSSLFLRSPNAIKLQANVITCAGTPQHAVEKKSELSAAANPPSTQAGAVKPNRHKQKQAEIPTISKEIGAYVRSKNSGVVASVKAVVIEGRVLTASLPSQLRFCQTPVNPASWELRLATIWPRGLSLENNT